MTDIIGPSSSAPNVVTARPADGRVFNALDTWFKACSAPGANDGTTISDAFLNGLLGILRTATRGMGIADSTAADNLLRDAIRAAKLRLAVAGGAADALTVAFSPPHVTYNEAAFFVVPAAANTGAAMTLALDGMAAKAVKYRGGDPPAGLFQAGVAQLLMYDGTNLQVMGGGFLPGLPKMTFLTTTATWTRAAGARWALPIVQGPGAAGGGDPTGANTPGGSGGGAGGYAADLLDLIALNITTATVTLPAGGVGVAGANGGDGAGNASFGAYLVAGPGIGGRAPGGTYSIPGGLPGVGITGRILGRGNPGGTAFATTPDIGANGGGSLFSGGGRGGTDDGTTFAAEPGALGSGGGGRDSADGSSGAGANGGDACCLVVEG